MQMKSKQAGRFYEVNSGDQTEVAIPPGENPLEFERLHTRLAEEWAPDGPSRRTLSSRSQNQARLELARHEGAFKIFADLISVSASQYGEYWT
jgi:hypothetical protein